MLPDVLPSFKVVHPIRTTPTAGIFSYSVTPGSSVRGDSGTPGWNTAWVGERDVTGDVATTLRITIT